MTKNYLEELKELIEKYKERGFEWGKPIDYLEFRNGRSKEEMEKELLDVKMLANPRHLSAEMSILNMLKNPSTPRALARGS